MTPPSWMCPIRSKCRRNGLLRRASLCLASESCWLKSPARRHRPVTHVLFSDLCLWRFLPRFGLCGARFNLRVLVRHSEQFRIGQYVVLRKLATSYHQRRTSTLTGSLIVQVSLTNGGSHVSADATDVLSQNVRYRRYTETLFGFVDMVSYCLH